MADQDQLRERLHAALPTAVLGCERWAERRVDRLIVQFRVELRLGERDGQVVVMFRSSCPVAERERLGALVLATLAGSRAG